MTIQEILEKYECFKKKWLKLNEQDLFDRLELQDIIKDKVIEFKSEYLEEKLVFDRDYWLKMIELKEMKGDDGKKKYTDATAKAVCDDEFFQREIELISKKTTYEMLLNKANSVIEYVNVVKLAMKNF